MILKEPCSLSNGQGRGWLARRVSVAAITKCGQHERQKSCFFLTNRQVMISIKTLQGNMLTKRNNCTKCNCLLTFFFKLNIEEHNSCRDHQHGGYYVAKFFITYTKFLFPKRVKDLNELKGASSAPSHFPFICWLQSPYVLKCKGKSHITWHRSGSSYPFTVNTFICVSVEFYARGHLETIKQNVNLNHGQPWNESEERCFIFQVAGEVSGRHPEVLRSQLTTTNKRILSWSRNLTIGNIQTMELKKECRGFLMPG